MNLKVTNDVRLAALFLPLIAVCVLASCSDEPQTALESTVDSVEGIPGFPVITPENVNIQLESGATPLMRALQVGPEKVTQLLSMGADPNLASNQGVTALHLAADLGDTEVIRLLVEAEADITAVTNRGLTPYETAARSTGTNSGPDRSEAAALLLSYAEEGKSSDNP